MDYRRFENTIVVRLNRGEEILTELKKICEAVSIPVVAIGGITQENVTKLKNSGICGVAVISAIYAQKDIRKASEQLKDAVKKVVG